MVSTIAPMHSPFSQPPQKKQKMSITQTYFLAHTARGKLAKEASRGDHDLRLLVGHANLLDELMLDLANAEQEQENWFNRTVSGAKAAEEEQKPAKQVAKHIQWADTLVEEEIEEDFAATSDSEDEDEEMEQETMTAQPIAITKSIVTTVSTRELTDEYDEDEDLEELALTRTESHHPPELTSDSDDESEDESMPPSPPSTTLEFTEKERQAIATTSFYDKVDHQLSESEQSHFLEEGFYIPSREQPAMIPAY